MSNKPNNPLSEIYEYLANAKAPSLKELVDKRKQEFGIGSDLQLSKLVGIDRMTLDRLLKGDTQKVDLFSIIKLDQFLQIGANEILEV